MRYPTEINSHLLAHIGGDAFIAETGWEGSSVGGNLDYLLNYLNSIELSPALNQLFNQLNKLTENNRQINQLYSEEELEEFVQDKASKINQLSHGEYLDLPGEWNYGAGHVLVVL